MMTSLPSVVGPPAYQRLRFLFDPIRFLEACERAHGDAFRLALGSPGLYVFSRPDHVKAIYAASPDVLRAGAAKRGIFGKVLGASSSLLLDGEPHVRRRKLLLPQFRGERMAPYGERIVVETEAAIARMPHRTPFALLPPLQSLTLRVMLHALAGAETASTRPLWRALEGFVTDAAGSRLLMAPALQWDLGRFSPWGRVTRRVAEAEAAVRREIVARRAAAREPHDLIDLLLASTDAEGTRLSDVEVCDEVLTLAVAGHEITSMVLAWLVHAVVSRPLVHDRVREELAREIGQEVVRPEEVARLTYLDGVLRESMRLHSVVPFGSARLVTEDTRIGEHAVPRGAVVNVALHLLHRRPEIFERPDELRPERFAAEQRVAPHEWAPFGGGSRRCLGMSFAMFEMKVIAATLFSRLELRGLGAPRPVRRGAFVAPSGGLRMIVDRARAPRRAESRRAAA